LRRRLQRLAQVYFDERGVDVRDLPRAGAAGGLAGGLASVGAALVDGFEVVAEWVGLYEKIEGADLIVTGEGRVDATSFDGKVVGGVCELAEQAGVPVAVLAGDVEVGFHPPVPVRTLVGFAGSEAARANTVAVIEQVTPALLGDAGRGT